MSRYFFLARWIFIQVGRFLDTNKISSFIYLFMYEIKIGSVLRRLLKLQSKTVKKVSQETGIPYSTLHTWLENRQPKDILKAQRLADYFGISLNQLLFDQEEIRNEELSGQTQSKSNDFFKGIFEITIKKIK
jgi:transcriptional regulator with XRE-family HTH domain